MCVHGRPIFDGLAQRLKTAASFWYQHSKGAHPEGTAFPPISPRPHKKKHVPTGREVAELSRVTLEAGPSVLELSEHARSSQVRGEVFSCEEIVQMRLRAIEWLTTQFAKFGYRDEWLTTAVNYMDRAACASTTSGATGNANSRSVELCDAAKQVMACRELWLAAVGAALRMSEAEDLCPRFSTGVFWAARLQVRPSEVAGDPCSRDETGAYLELSLGGAHSAGAC